MKRCGPIRAGTVGYRRLRLGWMFPNTIVVIISVFTFFLSLFKTSPFSFPRRQIPPLCHALHPPPLPSTPPPPPTAQGFIWFLVYCTNISVFMYLSIHHVVYTTASDLPPCLLLTFSHPSFYSPPLSLSFSYIPPLTH